MEKIILTTDFDLIKDDVQAINNEFLEWFAKNPMCEHVQHYTVDKSTTLNTIIKYELIIPKEELKYNMKQEALKEAATKEGLFRASNIILIEQKLVIMQNGLKEVLYLVLNGKLKECTLKKI